MKYSAKLTQNYPFVNDLRIEEGFAENSLVLLCSSIAKLKMLTPERVDLWDWINGIQYSFREMRFGGLTTKGSIKLNPRGLTEWTVVHELAHAWDASQGWQLSEQMRRQTHSHFKFQRLHRLFPEFKPFWYHVGSPPAPCGIDKNFTAKEDFAEALTAYLFPDDAYRRAAKKGYPYEAAGYVRFRETPRGLYIHDLLDNKNSLV